MANVLKYAAISAALLTPFGAFAQSLDCPDAPAVFSSDGSAASPASLEHLNNLIGTAELNSKSLDAVSEDLRADYPKASNAEIADLMISAYCTFLNKDAPESHRSEENVRKFEQQVYDTAFGGTPPADYKPHGWLYGN